MIRRFALAVLLATALFRDTLAYPQDVPPVVAFEAPRVRSLLEHGWAAESGVGQRRNIVLAARLYCQAARLGSAEAHYRAGRIYAGRELDNPALAVAFLSVAGESGHPYATLVLEALLSRTGPVKDTVPACLLDDTEQPEMAVAVEDQFDLSDYLLAMRPERKRVADLIAKFAPRYGIETRLALAIASVESNFDANAVSPKNAQGVMQLIPKTAERFKVSNPVDPEQNIRGGLAYLRWLMDYFDGDRIKVIAAYNAGEGAVVRYRGIPPFRETRIYVRRVLELSGGATHAPTFTLAGTVRHSQHRRPLRGNQPPATLR